MDRALVDNFDLRIAWNRLNEAQASLDRQSAPLFPSLDASGGASRSDDQRNPRQESNEFSAGLRAEYEVDLWSRIDNSVRAAELSRDASRQQVQTAAISLAGEVANTWYQLNAERARLKLLRDQLQTNRDLLSVIETRFRQGQVQAPDILRQRELIESTQQQIDASTAEVQALENQLAVLLGQAPGEANLPDRAELPPVPDLPETGVPSELVQQRPDLRQAYLEMRSADRQLAADVMDQYPSLTLSGSIDSSAEEFSNLLEENLVSLAVDVAAPIIDGGQRRAQVRESESRRQRLLNEWAQATLNAVEEVETALAREQSLREELQQVQKQLDLARRTTQQLRTQYLNGSTQFLDVLDSLTSEQQLRRDVISTRQSLIQQRINLYRALAGGLELEPPPDRKDPQS